MRSTFYSLKTVLNLRLSLGNGKFNPCGTNVMVCSGNVQQIVFAFPDFSKLGTVYSESYDMKLDEQE